ncbi:thioredoxin family protein [Allopusillimonas ginsengisoli]|uniref:thioredoxin family protein n=1 Tax=Allopusillimonas ginsengisoli TaxID=453575 RepID=UPI00101FA294|nr:thioredoxin family protein [Allopusillimonas ginsengisoli]TEA77449.1 thioredoxin [Allopusillimonas ginsengisoli]
MPVFDPEHNTPALTARLASQSDGLVIVCYCAAWCDTCNQYRPGFGELAERWQQHTFVWVDIEALPELLDDDDVENFPTLLIQNQSGNVFFGPLLPHINHLERLVERYDQNTPLIAEGPRRLETLLQSGA